MRNNPSDAYPRWEPWTRCVRWTICRLSVNRQISFHCILRLGVHDDDQCWRYSYWPSGNQTFPSLVQEPFWWWKVASGNPVYTGVKSHALYEFQTSILRVSQRVWAYVAWASLSAKRSFFFFTVEQIEFCHIRVFVMWTPYAKLTSMLTDMSVKPFETFPEKFHICGNAFSFHSIWHQSCIHEGSQDKVSNVRPALSGGIQCQNRMPSHYGWHWIACSWLWERIGLS